MISKDKKTHFLPPDLFPRKIKPTGNSTSRFKAHYISFYNEII